MQNKKKDNAKKLIHISFEIGLFFKGFDSILEIAGGILMLFLNPGRLNMITRFLVQPELLEDPKDKVANELLKLSQSFSIGAQYFGVIYLLTHGIIKFIIFFLLWRRKIWAYPFCIISLILFIAYQIYQYTISRSIGLILLTILDAIMIVLTYLEYRRIKSTLPKQKAE